MRVLFQDLERELWSPGSLVLAYRSPRGISIGDSPMTLSYALYTVPHWCVTLGIVQDLCGTFGADVHL